MKIDIEVNSKPVDISFECPNCKKTISIEYSDFCIIVGEPCDWEYSTIACPKCDKKVEIQSVDWI